jgi:Fe-S-cluster containining protein
MIPIQVASKTLPIHQVDERIFDRIYYADCLGCDFCKDVCCSHGCQVDLQERDRILAVAEGLEQRMQIPAERWFEHEPTIDPDFPSGAYVRAQTHNGKCVFYDWKQRGCGIHRYAVENGIDYHALKPMVCSLFPITWEQDRLFVSDFLAELPCNDQGPRVFDVQKDELKHYFGEPFVAAIERQAPHTST